MYKQLFAILISLSLCFSSDAKFTLFREQPKVEIEKIIKQDYNPLVFLGIEFGCVAIAVTGYYAYKCYKQYQLDCKPARDLVQESRDTLKRIRQIHNAFLEQPNSSLGIDIQHKMISSDNFKKIVIEEYNGYSYPFVNCKKSLEKSINECQTILEQLERRIIRIKDCISDHDEYIPKLEALELKYDRLVNILTIIKNEVEHSYEYQIEQNILNIPRR